MRSSTGERTRALDGWLWHYNRRGDGRQSARSFAAADYVSAFRDAGVALTILMDIGARVRRLDNGGFPACPNNGPTEFL